MKRNTLQYNYQPSQVKARPHSWLGDFQEIRFSFMGRNLIIPKGKVGSESILGEEDKVTIYRAESDINKRLNSSGVIEQKNISEMKSKIEEIRSNNKIPQEKRNKLIDKKLKTALAKEKTMHVNIGGDYKRTEDFMSQSRKRETEKEDTKILKNLRRFSNNIDDILTPEVRKMLKETINQYKFDANGQTIKWSKISRKIAMDIIRSALPEHYRNINVVIRVEPSSYLFSSYDVMNVDITKSHNQLGIRGNKLQQLKQEIAKNGVQDGTTYNRRRRSEDVTSFPRNLPWADKIKAEGKNKLSEQVR